MKIGIYKKECIWLTVEFRKNMDTSSLVCLETEENGALVCVENLSVKEKNSEKMNIKMKKRQS